MRSGIARPGYRLSPAGLYGNLPSMKSPHLYYRINVLGTLNVLQHVQTIRWANFCSIRPMFVYATKFPVLLQRHARSAILDLRCNKAYLRGGVGCTTRSTACHPSFSGFVGPDRPRMTLSYPAGKILKGRQSRCSMAHSPWISSRSRTDQCLHRGRRVDSPR